MTKDAYYFTHDYNAREDHKIKALIRKHGFKGYGWYWVILENLRAETGYKLKEKQYTWEALAEQMQCTCDAVKGFIKDCINDYELFTQEEGFFYSESLLKRMAKLDTLRQKRQYAGFIKNKNYEEAQAIKDNWDET